MDPNRIDACRARGDLWQKRKNYEKAIADYSRLLRLSPHDCHAYFERAFCRFQKKEYEKAISDLDEVLSRHPEWFSAYEGRGHAWSRLRAYDKAEDDFTESIRLQDQEALKQCRVVWSAVFQGDLLRARSSFSEFQAVFAPLANDFLERARCREALGDSDKALSDYQEALWINPNSPRGYHGRGEYWLEKKRFDLALADFDSALKLDPKYAPMHRALRGCCRAKMGQNDKALADLDEALRLGPDDPLVCYEAAWFRATCPEAKYRDGTRAVALAAKACQRTEWESCGAICTLAAAHAETGNFAEAVRWQKKALELATPATKKKMADRLALYESHKPYRAPLETPATAKNAGPLR